MSSTSSRDRPSPLFKRLTQPKAPDTELNQGKEKLTGQQGKSGKSHTDSDEKQRNSKRGKTDAGENQGNCGEIRNWKLSGVAMMENWLATAF